MYLHVKDYIYELFKQAEYNKKLMLNSTNEYKKNMHKNIINNNINLITYLIKNSYRTPSDNAQNTLKKFTLEELSKYDGSNGTPAYVCVDGIIYDVSNNSTWGGGTHFGLYAGKDLTEEFNSCHDIKKILDKLPKVGVLTS